MTGGGGYVALRSDRPEAIRRTCSGRGLAGGGIEPSPSNAPRLGNDPGITGSSDPSSAAGANEPRCRFACPLCDSASLSGEGSRGSVRPIASIAPPSISVSSLIVADVDNDGERDGDRLGRVGPASESGERLSGEYGVLIILGRFVDDGRGEIFSGDVPSALPRGEYLPSTSRRHIQLTVRARYSLEAVRGSCLG